MEAITNKQYQPLIEANLEQINPTQFTLELTE